MKKAVTSHIADPALSASGKKKIEWAKQLMPVLSLLDEQFRRDKPFSGIRIGACLHITSETANLMTTLKNSGASVALCACNPLSTKNDIAASLVSDFGIPVFAIHGENNRTYYQHIESVVNTHPHITMDDGGDLISYLHTKRQKQIPEIIGSNEETTTGVIRLAAMEKDGELKLPVVAVNVSQTKHMFDNRYGTGQSTIDGILRATNILLAGKKFVVCGYGWCGRGVAARARGMGAQVIVTEVDPVKALEAVMDGFRVATISEAAKVGDIFITVTGDRHVISLAHIKTMKDGAILANSGHFNAEIDIEALASKAKSKKRIRDYIDEYALPNGSRRYVLGEGRLVNLVAAEGHPSEVMDMSFANQVLAAKWLVENKSKLAPKVYNLPPSVDAEIASLKLAAMGVKIDRLTSAQKKYLTSWREGT